MSGLQAKIEINTWVAATWNEYVQILENPAYEKAKGYYYNGRMRIEIGLDIALLNEAFPRTRQTNQSQVLAWLLTQFQM